MFACFRNLFENKEFISNTTEFQIDGHMKIRYF